MGEFKVLSRRIQITAGSRKHRSGTHGERNRKRLVGGFADHRIRERLGRGDLFLLPLETPPEASAREEMEVGEIAYWPPGKAFCIFFGRTPASVDDAPRAASAVNPLGRVTGEPERFPESPLGRRGSPGESAVNANEPKDVSVLIHYDEIGLKGKNRPLFIERLSKRIERAASLYCEARVKKRTGRLILETNGLEDPGALMEALAKVFGVAYFARAQRVPLDLDAAANTALDMIAPLKTQVSGCGPGNRSRPRPLARERGTGPSAPRSRPEDTCPSIWTIRGSRCTSEVIPREAWVYTEKIPGPGGLPTGSLGRVAALLSGGIDSPLAAWRIMKRGCEVVFIHFHGAPYLSRASAEKAKDLAHV